MKSLKVNFIGADADGYREISGGNKYDKWDFKTNPVGEFVLMDRKTLNNKPPAPAGTYDLYTVIEKHTKKPYAFFTGKVLEDKLKNIPLYSLVRIKFEGAHPTKRYHIYKVDVNDNFRYDPQQFSLEDASYSEVKADATQQTTAQKGQAEVRKPVTQVEEDLPF